MHTGQLISVQADNPEQALSAVSDFAEATEWSDWWEFGGRWTTKEMEHGYLLTYDSNPDLFNQLLTKYEDRNQDTIRRALKRHGEVTITDLLTLPRYKSRSASIADGENVLQREKVLDPEAWDAYWSDVTAWYTVADALDVLRGTHTCETGYYDIEAWTTRPEAVIKRCQENSANQYLVVVDFHF